MNRRSFLASSLAASLGPLLVSSSRAQASRSQIYIKREYSLAQLVGSDSGSCIYGKLWVLPADRNLMTMPVLSVEKESCQTMELPDYFNVECLSLIPLGSYTAVTKVSPTLGWVIELKDVKGRTNVLVHAGNLPQNSSGCILVGMGRNPLKNCSCLVLDSKKKPIYDANGCHIQGGPTKDEVAAACAKVGIPLPDSKAAMTLLKSAFTDPLNGSASVSLRLTVA